MGYSMVQFANLAIAVECRVGQPYTIIAGLGQGTDRRLPERSGQIGTTRDSADCRRGLHTPNGQLADSHLGKGKLQIVEGVFVITGDVKSFSKPVEANVNQESIICRGYSGLAATRSVAPEYNHGKHQGMLQ